MHQQIQIRISDEKKKKKHKYISRVSDMLYYRELDEIKEATQQKGCRRLLSWVLDNKYLLVPVRESVYAQKVVDKMVKY